MRAAWIFAVAAVVLSGGCGGSSSSSGSPQPPQQQEPPPQQPPGEMPAPPQEPTPAPIDSPAGGTTQWVRRLGGTGDEAVIALAAGGDGTTTLLTRIGSAGSRADVPDAYGLVHLDRSGAVVWSKELSNGQHAALHDVSVAVSPAGNVFVAARVDCGAPGGCSVDFGGGLVGEGGSVLFKFEPPGELAWQRGPLPRLASNVAVDANGGALLVLLDDGGTAFLRKYGWDGGKLLELPAPRVHDPPNLRWAVAFDASGDFVVGNRVGFSRHDPGGKMLWSADLTAGPDTIGDVESIGTTALGTVVAVLTYSGTIEWAGTRATAGNGPGAFIAVAERDGAPRFGKASGGDIGIVGAAVDPAGRLAILTRRGGCDDEVWRWNLAGELLWRRTLATSCGAGGAMLAAGIAADPTSHDVVVGGGAWGTVDLGSGPVTSNGGADDFVVDLAP